MRWWLAVGVLATGLGCAGFGPAEPVSVPTTPADTDAPEGDAAAAVSTADTGEEAEPEADPGEPPASRGKRKVRAPKPGPKPPSGAEPDPLVPKKKKKAPPQPGPKPEGIEQVSDTSWRVRRSLVDHWQQDPYRLGNVREKEPGWEVIGVRPKDGYHLGVRNKDVVMEVNGHKLRTKPQLLSAYLDLKNDRVFDVTLVRAGVVRVHHYEVVE
jgi:hypothetical protein